LGTFEFLANPQTEDFFFLEINPRLQVEHTITESISSIDLVQTQLLISQGASLKDVGLRDIERDPAVPPKQFSCQLRLTAENVHSGYSLSIGKISSFQFPSGNGIRVDTNLVNGHATVVGSDFDSLLAKLIVTAPRWSQVVAKAKRALQDVKIFGVKTNLEILQGIVASSDFAQKDCDTQWLENSHTALLEAGEAVAQDLPATILPEASGLGGFTSSASSMLFRKGDAWAIELTDQRDQSAGVLNHHLQLTKVLRNEFPAQLAAEVEYTTPSSKESVPYTMTLRSTTSSASATTAQHRKGNPGDPSHVVIPFPGTLIEVMVDVGDIVKEGDVICVIRQMKMELEVRAAKSGTIGWLLEVEDGEEVAEGILAAELVFEQDKAGIQAKL
jgi:pyruvate carboxylase